MLFGYIFLYLFDSLFLVVLRIDFDIKLCFRFFKFLYVVFIIIFVYKINSNFWNDLMNVNKFIDFNKNFVV